MQIVFTGAFDARGYNQMTRPELARLCANVGLTIRNSVTRATDYLVTSHPSTMTVKYRKAQEYGINIISYRQFMEIAERRILDNQHGHPQGRLAPMQFHDGGRMTPRHALVTARASNQARRAMAEHDASALESSYAPQTQEPFREAADGDHPRKSAVGSTGKRALDI